MWVKRGKVPFPSSEKGSCWPQSMGLSSQDRLRLVAPVGQQSSHEDKLYTHCPSPPPGLGGPSRLLSGQAAAWPLETGGQLWEPSSEWPPRGGTGPLGAVLGAFHCLPVLPACQQLGDGGAGGVRRRGVEGEQNCVTRLSWCFHPLWGTSISGEK